MGLSSVSLNMAVINIKDESSIRDGLVSLAASDCVFNGENGLIMLTMLQGKQDMKAMQNITQILS